jgi:large subunit ribosomal protein L10
MSKMVKELITKELRLRYAQMDNAIWVQMIGIDGITTNQFRRELREKKLRLEVVRNALLRRAVGDGPLSRLADKLDGPAALITGGDSAVEAAKFIQQWLPRLKGMRVRGAMLEGEYLDESAAAGLALMPTKRDMQARLAGILRSPGANLASAMLSGGRNIAGCLKSLIEKLEKAGPVAAESGAAPASAAPAESSPAQAAPTEAAPPVAPAE